MTTGVKEVYLHGFSRLDFKNNPRAIKILDLAKSKLPKNPSSKILDIGCGDGNFTLAIGSELGSQNLYGIDISPEAVRQAQNRGINAFTIDVDHDALPFEDEKFDVVFCGNLIELVLDADHLLNEIHRVLSPQGTLIISFPNLASWASRISVLFGYHPFYDRISRKYNLGKLFSRPTKGDSTGFIRLLTKNSFLQLANLYKFNVLFFAGAQDNSLPAPIRIFDKFLSRFPSLAFQIICFANKNI